MNAKTLIQILLLFSSLSILSIGGGNTVLPEMHHKAVSNYHWLTDKQFADIFAISQSAPGPSILIVTMLGYKAAGVLGAILAASLAIDGDDRYVQHVARFDDVARMTPLATDLYREVLDVGGTISGEHGIGIEKRDYMAWIYTPEDIAAMLELRAAFDPRNVMNPCKQLPTGASCGDIKHAKGAAHAVAAGAWI
mgnify:CR=1 FL=1